MHYFCRRSSRRRPRLVPPIRPRTDVARRGIPVRIHLAAGPIRVMIVFAASSPVSLAAVPIWPVALDWFFRCGTARSSPSRRQRRQSLVRYRAFISPREALRRFSDRPLPRSSSSPISSTGSAGSNRCARDFSRATIETGSFGGRTISSHQRARAGVWPRASIVRLFDAATTRYRLQSGG